MLENTKRLHFTGIGGAGMSALGKILALKGYTITGSDNSPSAKIDALRSYGIAISDNHSQNNIADTDMVVYSSAISDTNIELKTARKKKIPTIKRGHLLALLTAQKKSIVVSGTHGKTTTSSMIAKLLLEAGFDPTIIIGGDNDFISGNARNGKSDWYVIEADESDGTLAYYEPYILIITNIEREHLDFYSDISHIMSIYKKVLQKTRHTTILYGDDPIIQKHFFPLQSSMFTYGFGKNNSFYASKRELSQDKSFCRVRTPQKKTLPLTVSIPGHHNLLNGLAAVCVGTLVAISPDVIGHSLSTFSGVKRRFHVKYRDKENTIIDDYAHHPTEIEATIQTAKLLPHKRIVVIYQPHRYSRTYHFYKEIAKSLKNADCIILTELYGATEEKIPGVSSDLIIQELESVHKKEVIYIPKLEEIAHYVPQLIKPQDILLTLGAGTITTLSDQLSILLSEEKKRTVLIEQLIQKRIRGPVCYTVSAATLTTIQVGGPIFCVIEPIDTEDLRAAILIAKKAHLPITLIGNGSNVIMKDDGFTGIVIRLTQSFFKQVHIKNKRVVVGAGVSISSFLKECVKQRISGYEFLTGIPGTIGGAIAMNAGAWGKSLSKMLIQVRIIDKAGKSKTVSSKELNFSYRQCHLPDSSFIIEAELALTTGKHHEIAQHIKHFMTARKKRFPVTPNAGCIFKNPENDFAGKIIDNLGLKGTTIGNAKISEKHGNVIVNTGNARAEDVFRLIQFIEEKVKKEKQCLLEKEVVVLP
ncbi:UDP-N-acetylmuramate--L-alanine ligase [Chlamydiota bacterium]